jgi:hypothetical protein
MRIVFIVLYLFLSACSKHHPAPVRETHHHNRISSAQALSKQHRNRAKYVHVKKGDTLYSLGFSHNIDFKTLAKINYRIHKDSIKENLIPKGLTAQQQSYTYANEADLLNMALFSTTAKEWREKNPDKKGNIRDYASLE